MIIKADQKPKVAKKDIVVYKRLNISDGKLYPCHFNTHIEYEIGVLNKTYMSEINLKHRSNSLSIKYFDDKEIEDFKIPNNTYLYVNDMLKHNISAIEQGFHSATKLNRLVGYDHLGDTLVECIIPKGSHYYTNKSDLAVSDKLIVVKIIDLEKNADSNIKTVSV